MECNEAPTPSPERDQGIEATDKVRSLLAALAILDSRAQPGFYQDLPPPWGVIDMPKTKAERIKKKMRYLSSTKGKLAPSERKLRVERKRIGVGSTKRREQAL